MNIAVVDLFCGIGGLSYGFKSEGFDVLAGIDSDISCKYAYETNIEADFLATDIEGVTGKQVSAIFARRRSSYRVLIGCAPCAPFSFYTGRYRKARRRDPKWQLLDEFGRLVIETKPDVVSMENVPRVVCHRVFREFVRDLKGAGYTVTYEKVRADQYGVPQKRSRLVLFASRWGEIRLPKPTHSDRPITVREAIGNLPPHRGWQTIETR
jgi:DNA (cytosine-5)-methyltransferase 1